MNRGSLILIGVLLIGILAFGCLTFHWPKVEQDILSRATAALQQAQMGWAEVEISGRDLTLRGMAPSANAIAQARTVVTGVVGVRKVEADFDIPATPSSTPATSSAATDPVSNSNLGSELDTTSSADRLPADGSGDPASSLAATTAPPQIPDEEEPAGRTSSVSESASSPDADTPIETQANLTMKSCQQELNQAVAGKKIQFAKNSAEVEPQSFGLLDAIAAIVLRCPEGRIEVSGHTDSAGPEDWNQRLSGLRAQAVVDNLRARGVARSRLSAVGRGSSQAIASDDTAAGRATNRRIEFKVLGKEA